MASNNVLCGCGNYYVDELHDCPVTAAAAESNPYFVKKFGFETGPFSEVQVRIAIANGEIGPDSMLRASGDWFPARELAEVRTGSDDATGTAMLCIAGAVGLFIVCSLIQAACGTNMFSSTYETTGTLKDWLVNFTFWPGWIGTVGLAVLGVFGLVRRD